MYVYTCIYICIYLLYICLPHRCIHTISDPEIFQAGHSAGPVTLAKM